MRGTGSLDGGTGTQRGGTDVIDTLGAIVGVLVLAGAVGLILFRGPTHATIKRKLWKLIAVSVLVLLIIGYLRSHDIR